MLGCDYTTIASTYVSERVAASDIEFCSVMRTALPRPCRILLVYAASTTLLPGAFALAASSAVSQEGPQLELAVVLLVSLAAIIGITIIVTAARTVLDKMKASTTTRKAPPGQPGTPTVSPPPSPPPPARPAEIMGVSPAEGGAPSHAATNDGASPAAIGPRAYSDSHIAARTIGISIAALNRASGSGKLRIEGYDKNGDNRLGADELLDMVDDLGKKEKEKRELKEQRDRNRKALRASTGVIVLLVLAIFGVSFAASELAKALDATNSGIVRAKGTQQVAKVAVAKETVPMGLAPFMTDVELMSARAPTPFVPTTSCHACIVTAPMPALSHPPSSSRSSIRPRVVVRRAFPLAPAARLLPSPGRSRGYCLSKSSTTQEPRCGNIPSPPPIRRPSIN